MELLLVFLCTAIGTVVGVTASVLLMNRRNRLPPTEAQLVLEGLLRQRESDLSTATANLEVYSKQAAERNRILEQNREDLKTKQGQIEQAMAAAERESALHSAAECRATELAGQAAAFADRINELEARLQEEVRLQTEEASRQVESLQTHIDIGNREIEDLNGRIERLTAELTERSRSTEEADSYRSSLEAHLDSEREKVERLTVQAADLTGRLSDLEAKVRQERQAVANGMELLSRAQDELSGVFRARFEDGPGGEEASCDFAAAASESSPEELDVEEALVPALT